jgi:2-polyprenyl-6-methoxyphenol hydroxylase-like FAD-dependent oxidoreductase
MLPDTTDVLVIGVGPAGLTAAVSLAARGRGVIVADNQAEGQNTSRASVVYPRTLELLDPYGVAEPLAARGIHARWFTSRDHDRILMTVPFGRLPTAPLHAAGLAGRHRGRLAPAARPAQQPRCTGPTP